MSLPRALGPLAATPRKQLAHYGIELGSLRTGVSCFGVVDGPCWLPCDDEYQRTIAYLKALD